MNDLTPAHTARRATGAPLGWLRTEIDRLFDDFGPARSLFNFGSLAPVPALELSSGDKEYRLAAELPGLTEADVEISVADGILTLKGEKREAEEHKEAGYLMSERRYGKFERRIALPEDVDGDRIEATFAKGVLTVTLPRSEQAHDRARKIAISTAG
ncbi:Hsp20/alpha crystallin family protein [Sphingomonas sp. UNC305MFCol5.2]|uniref:Hsp20/alpha crystallin family protein n=1 Tax=Sphingomonas sp. UNC305MFCol5.2 TaxID=1449076 RepID=UPI0005655E27|nr:Hsp20/alpha crystallin family protein [Sphingomonas sp. UNC305MFCol5.2]